MQKSSAVMMNMSRAGRLGFIKATSSTNHLRSTTNAVVSNSSQININSWLWISMWWLNSGSPKNQRRYFSEAMTHRVDPTEEFGELEQPPVVKKH